MRSGSILALLALLGAVACSGSGEFADWTVPVPDGARIIGHEHVPVEERTERIELVEDLVVGRDDDPQYRFYQAWGLAVDSDGNIYVMERGNHRVQVFDPEGRYLRTLGSEGQGPGQLQQPTRIAVAGDVVVVVDPANGRLNQWSTAGEYLGAPPLEERSLRVQGLADGTLVGTHVIFHREPEFWRERLYGHFSLDGALLTRYTVFRSLPSVPISVPYSTSRLAVTPDGDVYITRADRYQVLAFEAGGEPRWALRTTMPLRRVPQEIFDDALERLRERQPDYEPPRDAWPEYMPAIGNMVVDGRGNLYVFHYVFTPRDPYTAEPTADAPDEYAVDVYSPEGELLSAALIDKTGWTAALGDHVYVLGRDPESDEEVVRRYRLVRPWER